MPGKLGTGCGRIGKRRLPRYGVRNRRSTTQEKREWMRKRLTKAVVTAIVAALAAAFMVAFVWLDSDDEASASYRSLDYEATVQTNGDLKIVQHIDYHFKKREDDNGHTKYWRQLYWQYTLDSTNLTNITDIKVKNTTTGAEYSQINPQNPDRVDQYTWDSKFANHWYIADVTNGSSYPEPFDTQNDGLDPNAQEQTRKTVEVGWNIPYTVKADSMTFDVEMTFHGVATKYKDITSFQWEPISPTNGIPAAKVTGVVRFPDGIDAKNSWGWLHTKNNSETERGKQGELRFTVYDLKSEQYVDVVAAFDSAVASDVARTELTDHLDALKADEAKQEKAWRDSQHQKAVVRVVIWILSLVIGIGSCVLAIIAVIRSNKASRYRGGLEYWRDRPSLSPASAARMIDIVGEAKGSQSSRSMTATILALAAKHAIAIYPGPASNYKGIDMSTADPVQISHMIASDGAKALASSRTSTIVIMPDALHNRETLNLSQSEQKCLRLLVSISMRVGYPVFDLKQMKDACKDWTSGYKELEAFESACDTEFALLGATSQSAWRYMLPGSIAAGIGLIICINGFFIGNLVLGFLIGMPMFLIGVFCDCAGASETVTPAGQEYAGQCLGLRNYMQDFSDFSDRGAADLKMWDWYLVYAAAFGISERVMKELAKAYPQVRDQEWLDANGAGSMWYWSYSPMYWGSDSTSNMSFGGGFGGSTGMFDIGTQIDSGFSAVRSTISAAAPSSSSGGSGGSFSGGGFGGSSGGSGGGSSGAR